MSDFFLKYKDAYPVLRAYLSDANGYVNLSGANVNFIYRDRQGLNAPVTGNVDIISPVSGLVQFAFPTGENAVVKGTYFCEWRAILNGGFQMSFPNDSFLSFSITESLN